MESDADAPLILRLPLWLRLASIIPGGVLVAAALVVGATSVGGLIAQVLIAGFGVLITVRLFRMSVTLHPDRAVVRGFFWSRTVPRARAEAMHPLGWIMWRLKSGRRWATPISAFWAFGSAPSWYIHFGRRAQFFIDRWIREDSQR